jgi:hypothetical protein
MQILDNEDVQGTPGQQWENAFLNIGMNKKGDDDEKTNV